MAAKELREALATLPQPEQGTDGWDRFVKGLQDLGGQADRATA